MFELDAAQTVADQGVRRRPSDIVDFRCISGGGLRGEEMEKRRWRLRPQDGEMINDLRVIAEGRRASVGPKPEKRVIDGLTLVVYRRPRVYLDRDAWEMLPPDGVLVMQVRPTHGEPFALALTHDELERTFGEVKLSKSWDTARSYHFPSTPPAAEVFVVKSGLKGSSRPVTTEFTWATRTPQVVRSSRGLVEPAACPSDLAGSFGSWASWWYERLRAQPEDADYLAGVAAWRQVWRPDRVRGLIVAESHVAQAAGDLHVKVEDAIGVGNLPDQFVRLVYCLGYGESEVCDPKPVRNGGTIQYWDILGQVARAENQPRRADSTLRQRLEWKVSVLNELRNRGIWLVDASPLGVYLGSGRRVAPGMQIGLIRDGFRRWVWPAVRDDQPEQVWTVGRKVGEALNGLEGIDLARNITQPQDRSAGRHREGLLRMSRDLRALNAPEDLP